MVIAKDRAERAARKSEHRMLEFVLLAGAAMLVCFCASTLYTNLRMKELATHSERVSASALPTVVHLSRLRGQVSSLQRALDDVADGRAPARPSTIDDAFARMGVDAVACTGHGEFAGEAALRSDARAALEDLKRKSERVAADVAEGSGPRVLVGADLRLAADRADAALARLIDFNAANGEAAGREVEAVRTRVTQLAVGLDLATVLISVAALALVVHSIRRNARAMQARASELETFAHRVAHDIRGPLGPALVALDVASRSSDDATRRFATRGVRSIERVQCIIDDLLAFALGGGQVDKDASSNLRDVVGATMHEVEAFARERKTEIVAEELPEVEVACSTGVLSSIVSNLVRNAIKFMGDRPVRRVTVRAALASEHVRIEVEDTGPGIPAAHQDSIFERYLRGPRAPECGLGLGLATVRRLVEAHGGHVSVRSAAGEGATFSLTLPLASPREPQSCVSPSTAR
jgi:signal transduction histidine kinase